METLSVLGTCFLAGFVVTLIVFSPVIIIMVRDFIDDKRIAKSNTKKSKNHNNTKTKKGA